VVFLYFYDLFDMFLAFFLHCFFVVFKSKIHNCWNERNSSC